MGLEAVVNDAVIQLYPHPPAHCDVGYQRSGRSATRPFLSLPSVRELSQGALALTGAWNTIQSFYRGLWGPSLRSALQGGIAYPGGLGPKGPDQNFDGCSPPNR